MILPFHCVLHCDRKGSSSLIVAASGDSIYSFAASTGSLLSSWSQSEVSSRTVHQAHNYGSGSADHEAACTERPIKRRKLSGSGEVSDSTSAEIVIDNDTKKPRRRKVKVAPISAVISIIVNSTGKHIVAVTAEDKCIRVLEVLADGKLQQISERHMPKRPCSVTFTTDESMLLCADKFGDVYALPFFEPFNDKKDGTNEQPMRFDQPKEEAKSKPFVPAATALTVHTKRNQQALKNQQNATGKTSEKKSLEFTHQLLLGHVSLLTDLAYVTVLVAGSISPSTRSYLLTSDRDEHIRISRGLPQAHIIEGYCLGHTEFVSKLCVPPWDHNSLLSGGGDDYLLVWNWLSSEVQQRVELKPLVAGLGKKIYQEPRRNIERPIIATGTGSIAVTGIWAIRTPGGQEDKHKGYIIVACERVPALVIYSWHENGTVEHHETLEVEGNVLDVATIPTQMSILYTID
ncbi:tRNA (guanine-N(7)-)-methyltransferase non-catalytic subunit trm82, partial [Xylographa bjoerkii]|nr:tRNA (guanine-N(7)-)-methyltransferase non-catalytic subunit trm82 [Xylographa bjoerkii]MCJ1396485.1 tRNA (guanine-N(7)-)-methyltransferase non-catalytic subunit trm82 [Xylographa bjoerkii]